MNKKKIFFIWLFFSINIILTSECEWQPPNIYDGYVLKGLREEFENIAVYESKITGLELDVSVIQKDSQYFVKKVFKQIDDGWETIIQEDKLPITEESPLLQTWLKYKKQQKEEFDLCD